MFLFVFRFFSGHWFNWCEIIKLITVINKNKKRMKCVWTQYRDQQKGKRRSKVKEKIARTFTRIDLIFPFFFSSFTAKKKKFWSKRKENVQRKNGNRQEKHVNRYWLPNETIIFSNLHNFISMWSEILSILRTKALNKRAGPVHCCQFIIN